MKKRKSGRKKYKMYCMKRKGPPAQACVERYQGNKEKPDVHCSKVENVSKERCQAAELLSVKGKDLGDFLLLERNNTELLLKCESKGLTSVTSWGPNMAMLST